MSILILFRSRGDDFYSLSNAINLNRSLIEVSYKGYVIGLTRTLEPLRSCEGGSSTNFKYSMALLAFETREYAESFLRSAGFLEVAFLPDCEIYLLPVLNGLKLGSCWTTILITELVSRDTYRYLPPRGKTYGINEIGGVPVAVDVCTPVALRGGKRPLGGFRIHQFPGRLQFTQWFNSEAGKEFKQDIRTISGLNTYLATFV